MLSVCLILVVLILYPVSSAGIPTQNSSPHLGNCPRDAVENQACNNGQGYCSRHGESPGSAEPQLKCLPGRPCDTLPIDPHGFFVPTNLSDITMGATARLVCCEGYETREAVEVSCSAFTTWNNPSDVCQPIDCGRSPPSNTTFIFLDGTAYTNFALLECLEGFNPVESSTASSVAVCAADGTWRSSLQCAPMPERSGTSFVFGLIANYVGMTTDNLHVYVFSSYEETEVTVSAPLFGFSTTTTVTGSAEIVIPSSLRTPANTGVFDLGFHVESSHPIDVYVEDPRYATCEGSSVFPETYLSNEYAIVSWRENFASSIAVVGTADDTDVTITIPGGDTVTTTINHYQLYHYMSTVDLTGAIVSCSTNCAVFAGSQCTDILGPYCDFLYEHMPPTAKLQLKYIASFPFPRRKFAVKVIAVHDNTNVQTTGMSTTTTLNRGEFGQYTFNDETVAVVSDKPVLVADFSLGRRADPYIDIHHDPAMLVLPGIEGFRSEYDFIVPADVEYATLMITIPSNSDAIADLVLNGDPFNAELTRQVNVPDEGSFTVLYATVPAGHNEVSTSIPFIVSLSFFRLSGETWLTLPYNF